MSEKFIPEHIDPFRYADQDLSISGLVRINDMARLSSMVAPSADNAEVDLTFGIDEQKIVYLKGHLKASLMLQCQRCMEPFVHEIISDFALGIVKTFEDANQLPEHYEPALVNEENHLALRDLIEDELILNLPIIPRHEEKDCKVKLPLSDSGWDEANKANPFQVLETLKKDSEKK